MPNPKVKKRTPGGVEDGDDTFLLSTLTVPTFRGTLAGELYASVDTESPGREDGIVIRLKLTNHANEGFLPHCVPTPEGCEVHIAGFEEKDAMRVILTRILEAL